MLQNLQKTITGNNSYTQFISNTLLQLALILLTIYSIKYLYLHGIKITGPFIFGDETTYFSFSRTLAQRKSIIPFTQYGPLYPILTSFMFMLGNAVVAYKSIKIFNIIIFVSTIIPAYLLAQHLFTNKCLQALLPISVIITPFSGLVYLIWAEPLYIALFYWSCFLLYTYTKCPSLIKSLLLAMFISALYYTKTAAGLIGQIAILITLIAFTLFTWKSETYKTKLLTGLAICTGISITLPWMIHYHNLGLSIIGYPSATRELNDHLIQQGYYSTIQKIIDGLFYQFSYVFIGSWGMIGICFGLLVTQWKYYGSTERNITIFILLYISGLIALSAIGMASFSALDYKMPNGRYFSLLFPLLIVLSLHLLFKARLMNTTCSRIIYILIYATIIIAIIASPLYSRSPLAFNSMPEISSIIYILDNKLVAWRPIIQKPSFLLRISVPIIMGSIAILFFALRKKSYTPALASIIITMGMFYSTKAEQHYIQIIATTQSGINNLYIYMINNNINIDNVYFDKKLEISNIPFMTQFWMDKAPHFINIMDMKMLNKLSSPSYFVSTDEISMSKQFSSYQYIIYKIDHL